MTDVAQGGNPSWSPERSAAGGHNPYLIAFVVSIATFMEVLDTTIANVALRHIAGGLAVGIDESTYVITSYLVANAIVLSISGWLSTVIGRKRFYMMCVATFAIASLLCGFAWSLESLVLFRIIQGLGGGGMATSEQAILADSFPPAKRGQAFAIYGVAVVVAPVVGPTLGGWITDTYTWHWVFLINVPMGLLSLFLVGSLVSEPSGAEEEREKLLQNGLRVDYIGFALVAVGLGSLEFVLDEGQRKDWFGSNMIVGFALASAFCLLALIPWELTRKDPIVDIRLLGRRQFGACFLVMLGTGAVLISTTQLLPQLLQTELGYTAMLAGLALSPGGIFTLMMMPIVGNLVGVVQPKYLIVTGACVVAFAMWHLTGLNGAITYGYAAWSRIFLGKYRGVDGRGAGTDRSGAAPAIPSKPAGRACRAVRYRIPADYRRDDALFPGAGLERLRCGVTGDRLGGTDPAAAGRFHGLYRRVLDACGGWRVDDPACAHHQAGRSGRAGERALTLDAPLTGRSRW